MLKHWVRKHVSVVLGATLLVTMILVSIGATVFSSKDPKAMSPLDRLQGPSFERMFGTDAFGRDLWSRTTYGGRISLVVGLGVAIFATVIGCFIGLLSGYFRAVDSIAMRIMDGLMAIPSVLLAIALATISRPSVYGVMIAIVVPEVPRVARLVRSVVLSLREQTFVEAAFASGTSIPRVLWRHILPGTLSPLLVQSTYICASAIITEAYLSFLGAGIPLDTPSWGNIMAEGRTYFHQAPWIILVPGLFLGATVLAINVIGDGLRDMLDPRLARTL
jgi:peptide/nickel transport system permease protein